MARLSWKQIKSKSLKSYLQLQKQCSKLRQTDSLRVKVEVNRLQRLTNEIDSEGLKFQKRFRKQNFGELGRKTRAVAKDYSLTRIRLLQIKAHIIEMEQAFVAVCKASGKQPTPAQKRAKCQLTKGLFRAHSALKKNEDLRDKHAQDVLKALREEDDEMEGTVDFNDIFHDEPDQ
ncbi:unnamed protein product [Caenorhabditis auriculariae]|uniref:Uncharacterized protein n=1 Tax=Caenorhabditis auriculariae TaxID=2777116 RepID=A0A8S1HA91_9PELO|nr:unnamed protein product [Caenorhabditis auriculariae]